MLVVVTLTNCSRPPIPYRRSLPGNDLPPPFQHHHRPRDWREFSLELNHDLVRSSKIRSASIFIIIVILIYQYLTKAQPTEGLNMRVSRGLWTQCVLVPGNIVLAFSLATFDKENNISVWQPAWCILATAGNDLSAPVSSNHPSTELASYHLASHLTIILWKYFNNVCKYQYQCQCHQTTPLQD